MPATAPRIAFILQEFRRAITESPSVRALYGKRARETDGVEPTFLDEVADADAIGQERMALLGLPRRRFKARVSGLDEMMQIGWHLSPPFDSTDGVIPVAQFVDRERDADLPVIVSEIVIDFGKQQAELEVWG